MQSLDLKTHTADGQAAGVLLKASGAPVLRVLALSILIAVAALLSGCSSQATVDEEVIASKPLIWPDPPEPARISYIRSISTPKDIGAGKGFFKRVIELVLGSDVDDIIKPYGIAVDSRGRVIVADTAFKRVHIYDLKENKYRHIDFAGKASLISPISVAVDEGDNIYVTDSMARKVFVYNAKGKYQYAFDAGTRPTGIALGSGGKLLYVVDTGEHVVDVYDLKGKKVKTFGGWGSESGSFNHPVDIFIDGNGEIYIVDTMNYKIQIFDKDGRFVTMFGHQGDGTGDFGRPKGVAVDKDGHIYVADALFDTVQIFDREGRFLLNFGRLGSERGNFWIPGGVFIDQGNKVYVSDTFNRRVQIFEYLGDAGLN
jgi:DNA-binding beta-propeller fold protein YncE